MQLIVWCGCQQRDFTPSLTRATAAAQIIYPLLLVLLSLVRVVQQCGRARFPVTTTFVTCPFSTNNNKKLDDEEFQISHLAEQAAAAAAELEKVYSCAFFQSTAAD